MKKNRDSEKTMPHIKAEIGTGSVYEQLGYKNHKEMETKSILVMEMSRVIKKKNLTQAKAGKILGISQPKLSALLNGRFAGYSVERLLLFLNKLGQDIDIIVKSKPRNRSARVNVYRSGNNCYPDIRIAAKGR